MGKVYTRFQTKKAQKPYRLAGGTYLWGLYKGVPPPPPQPDGRYCQQRDGVSSRYFDGFPMSFWIFKGFSLKPFNFGLRIEITFYLLDLNWRTKRKGAFYQGDSLYPNIHFALKWSCTIYSFHWICTDLSCSHKARVSRRCVHGSFQDEVEYNECK